MEQKLKDYTNDNIYYTPIMNIIMNNRSENWYAIIILVINHILIL